MPQAKKEDASSLCQLINHVSSHMNALQALSLNVSVQDLMLNHLMLATLDTKTQRESSYILLRIQTCQPLQSLSHSWNQGAGPWNYSRIPSH